MPEMLGKLGLSLLLLAAAAAPARGEGPAADNTATSPTTYTQQEQDLLDFDRVHFGEAWNQRVAAFHADNLKRAPGGIVMVGASIMEWFPLEKCFPGVSITNRGIAGDTILGLIKRDAESMYELKPSKVFLMIGHNTVAGDPNQPIGNFELQYGLLFKRMRQHLPGAKVYIQSLTPVSGHLVEQYPNINARINEVNVLLKKLAAENRFEFLNTHPLMANEKGELRADYTADGLHPTEPGYLAWAAFLKPYVEN